MTESRFERYVREQVKGMVEPVRAELQGKLDAEGARVEKLVDRAWGLIASAVEKGVKDAVAFLSDKDIPRSGKSSDEIVREISNHLSIYSFQKTVLRYRSYYCDILDWGEGSKAREYADRLEAIDNFVKHEVDRLVVYKKDLGMKAEDFDRELAAVRERALKL